MSQSNRCRRLSVAPLEVWSDEGEEPWVVEVLRWGYQIPFCQAPTLSRDPIPFPAYCPDSIRGKALVGEVQSLLAKGAIEIAPLPSPGFYSRLFVVMKALGAWRPVIDLHSELEDSAVIFQDGDTSICSSLGSSGRLDGVSGLEGCVLAGSNASGIAQVPQVHGGGEGCTNSRFFALVSPRLHKSSPGSWLLCQPFFTGWGGAASPVPRRLVAAGLWGSSSIGRSLR